MNTAARVTLTAATVALLAIPTDLVSCGPFIPQALFVASRGPVDPRADYQRHYVGIVSRDWYTEPLIMAYRYTSGLDLSEAELSALYPGKKRGVGRAVNDPPTTPIEIWLAARKAIPNAPPLDRIDPTRTISKPDSYVQFQNCLDDSFRTATATLKARTAQWGVSNAQTIDWLAAQDAVFSNCSGPPTEPAPAPANAPTLLKQDRAYQSAAALFYAMEYTGAHQQFQAIAKDSSSPWHTTAAYLATRATLRDGTVNNKNDQLSAASRELTALHTPQADRLLQFADNRLHRDDRLSELSTQLSQPRLGPDPLQVVTDFRFVFLSTDTGMPRPTAVHTPLTDWLQVWRGSPEPAAVVTEWRERGTLPWLIAALSVVDGKDAAVPDILAAAAKVAPASPAFPSVSYYASKIAPDPRHWINQALALKLNDSDYNMLLARRFTLARNFDDFLRDAPRRVSLYSPFDDAPALIDGSDPEVARFRDTIAFDDDSVALWNSYVSLDQWMEAAKSPGLEKNLRIDLARAGWVRAAILNDPQKARAFLTLWSELNPADARPALPYLQTPDTFTAAQIFLHNPGFSPYIRSGFGRVTKDNEQDSFRGNWWCAAMPPSPPLAVPAFLPQQPTPDSAPTAQNASSFIPNEIVAYAAIHPNDPAIPDALAKSLDVAHRSYCQSTDDGAPSRKAFELLKSRYAATKAAQRTKYWYK